MMAAVNFASADTIRGINIDFVTIGNAENTGDTRTGIDPWGINPLANPYGCGAVAYNFRIGKYEITNTQWNAFTAAAGAPTGNDGGYPGEAYDDSASFTGAQQPTNGVSWYEAAQFCNYLTSGDKSKGAYQFSGNNVNPGDFLGINRASAIASYGTIYVLPTEAEWYKAAYYKPDGSGYSLYANGLDSIPAADNGWNYYDGTYSNPWNVGSGTQEQNGTFDMMGNVDEWNETLYDSSYRVTRGGSFIYRERVLSSSAHCGYYEYGENSGVGFRVAEVPEPCSLVLLSLGGLALLRKHKA
jgi:formylglycine-generating enzyme required for sulfatase activity